MKEKYWKLSNSCFMVLSMIFVVAMVVMTIVSDHLYYLTYGFLLTVANVAHWMVVKHTYKKGVK